MEMNIGSLESNTVHCHEEALLSAGGIEEQLSADLDRIDLDLVYSNEKLVNLHVLLMLLLGWDNGPEGMALENSDISARFIEKALTFDLLCGILDSELREIETFFSTVQSEIVEARRKTSSCMPSGAQIDEMDKKLHDSEESMKKCQGIVSEVKFLSTKLQASFPYFRNENWNNNEAVDISEQYQLSNLIGKYKVQTVEQQRQILRLLDRSLARELDLEKKLSKSGLNEDQVKLKLHYTEQVALRMEEAAEVVWGRFLEAENASEVLMGISKELLGRLQIGQFNLNGSILREAELKSKLEGCIEDLNVKDIALKKLEISNAEHAAKASEVLTLRKNMKLLEEQLKESELQLKKANASNETSQEHLQEMEIVIDSLKESLYEAENRAESAEAKVSELTDTNLELTEELNFLKGNNEKSTKKVTSLEKQLRESEIQLQHSKASSEASQEQQNMLYSAIWDMEILIEDLKSKVSKAESRTDSMEEQCIILSESNSEINDELGILRHKIECLETSLNQAHIEKDANAKQISHQTKLITDMVAQLASERERIQKQLSSLVNEKEILMKKLQNKAKANSTAVCNSGDDDGDEISVPKSDWSTKPLENAVPSATSVQVDEPSKDESHHRKAAKPFGTGTGSDTSTVPSMQVVEKAKTGNLKLSYMLIVILIALISALAMYFSRVRNRSSSVIFLKTS
ncbi:WPP domain-interacting tail-anchored protein 2-like isoform X2 [Hibiscus syriacus]|uniref:WPP domain-interacting tail-anchored protein 2-like isoform X2 n=1 Tax=Hibiscus syriacus TaxID=106335 RepID=UPI001924E391|nr:WPP domain-interacting tail-anchored protein 2-like isoform X2 [Hibiscus syriacus]